MFFVTVFVEHKVLADSSSEVCEFLNLLVRLFELQCVGNERTVPVVCK